MKKRDVQDAVYAEVLKLVDNPPVGVSAARQAIDLAQAVARRLFPSQLDEMTDKLAHGETLSHAESNSLLAIAKDVKSLRAARREGYGVKETHQLMSNFIALFPEDAE